MVNERSMEVSDSDHTMTTDDHAHEFICADCGDQVHKFGDHDGLSVCATCRFIRENPDMPEEIKRTLRGQPDTSEIEEATESWFDKARKR